MSTMETGKRWKRVNDRNGPAMGAGKRWEWEIDNHAYTMAIQFLDSSAGHFQLDLHEPIELLLLQ